ncbi:hypothetical protein NDU88_004679 [Pleurodeles waltl]|uniref:Uncharacterized protein n=1 Tax=Pleurodeles waltl TaxID=8319 RepID=A0AAV7PDI4_PLEWA|nr:hypothetical protein NDU88_004679 [Pleurodeles waltl]
MGLSDVGGRVKVSEKTALNQMLPSRPLTHIVGPSGMHQKRGGRYTRPFAENVLLYVLRSVVHLPWGTSSQTEVRSASGFKKGLGN